MLRSELVHTRDCIDRAQIPIQMRTVDETSHDVGDGVVLVMHDNDDDDGDDG